MADDRDHSTSSSEKAADLQKAAEDQNRPVPQSMQSSTDPEARPSSSGQPVSAEQRKMQIDDARSRGVGERGQGEGQVEEIVDKTNERMGRK